MKKLIIISIEIIFCFYGYAQNVGIGTTAPKGKLHIKGNADTTQLVIEANSTQSNTRPLIRFRNSAGQDIMHIHTDSEYNLFMGINAGRVNNAAGGGLYNTFIGSSCGYYNTLGSRNTAIGRNALFQNTEGFYNTSIGFRNLFSNTIGYNNTSIGHEAMLGNISGIDNTAIGTSALEANSNGSGNIAIGNYSLASQSFQNGGAATFTANTAVGHYALYKNQPNSNTNGRFNTAIGSSALFNNTTGYQNTAIGQNALSKITDGFQNVAIGQNSLSKAPRGYFNVAVGVNTQVDNPDLPNTGNTVIGANAHILGIESTVVGFNAYTNLSGLALLESASTTIVGGYANWTNFSDGRFKKDVNEEVKGLDFIMRLRPVTYHMNVRALYNHWGVSPY